MESAELMEKIYLVANLYTISGVSNHRTDWIAIKGDDERRRVFSSRSDAEKWSLESEKNMDWI